MSVEAGSTNTGRLTTEYIGDGVYATYDGYYIHLDLRGQDSTTKIALEPSVLEDLVNFAKRMRKEVHGD